jgi:hypothetical protein
MKPAGIPAGFIFALKERAQLRGYFAAAAPD